MQRNFLQTAKRQDRGTPHGETPDSNETPDGLRNSGTAKFQANCRTAKLQNNKTPDGLRNSDSKTPDRQQTAGRRNSRIMKLQTDCEIPGQRNFRQTANCRTAKLRNNETPDGLQNSGTAKLQPDRETPDRQTPGQQTSRTAKLQDGEKAAVARDNVF